MAKSKKTKQVIFEEEDRTLSSTPEATETNPSTVENIISVGLGLAVVLVIGAMIVNVIRGRNSQTETPTAAVDEKSATISATHVVKAGDTLWSIAEQYYNDGFKWTEIQKANNLTQANTIENGTEILIPKLDTAPVGATGASSVVATTSTPTEPTAPTAPSNPSSPSGPTGPTGINATGPTGSSGTQETNTSAASTDKQYTVAAGDTLWDIAVKRYNNGYRWSEIARMNNLTNPDLIFSGNVLLMP